MHEQAFQIGIANAECKLVRVLCLFYKHFLMSCGHAASARALQHSFLQHLQQVQQCGKLLPPQLHRHGSINLTNTTLPGAACA